MKRFFFGTKLHASTKIKNANVLISSIITNISFLSVLEVGCFHYGQNWVCFDIKRKLLPLCPILILEVGCFHLSETAFFQYQKWVASIIAKTVFFSLLEVGSLPLCLKLCLFCYSNQAAFVLVLEVGYFDIKSRLLPL